MPSLDRLHRPVLVLNASYEPINICAARRALVLVLKGVASAEEESQAHVHSPRHSIRVPSVIGCSNTAASRIRRGPCRAKIF